MSTISGGQGMHGSGNKKFGIDGTREASDTWEIEIYSNVLRLPETMESACTQAGNTQAMRQLLPVVCYDRLPVQKDLFFRFRHTLEIPSLF